MEDNKIIYLTSNKIIFKNMKGVLALTSDFIYLQSICKINTNNYDSIYKLDNGWCGAYLLVKNNNYHFIECGSGRPIIAESYGTIKK
jgi:hypothetical protein